MCWRWPPRSSSSFKCSPSFPSSCTSSGRHLQNFQSFLLTHHPLINVHWLLFLKALTIQTSTQPVILKSFSGSPSFIQSTEVSGLVRHQYLNEEIIFSLSHLTPDTNDYYSILSKGCGTSWESTRPPSSSASSSPYSSPISGWSSGADCGWSSSSSSSSSSPLSSSSSTLLGWSSPSASSFKYKQPCHKKMTVRGTMVRSDVCNSWCYCLGSQHQHFGISKIYVIKKSILILA